jgi:hypothetical protein
MSRSISKIRHLQKLNESLEKRYLYEQDEDAIELSGIDISAEKIKNLPEVNVSAFSSKLNSLIDKMDDLAQKLEDCNHPITTDKINNYRNSCREDMLSLVSDIESFHEKFGLDKEDSEFDSGENSIGL